MTALTVGDLRKAIALLSDDHPILVEGHDPDEWRYHQGYCPMGLPNTGEGCTCYTGVVLAARYNIVKARAIGLKTDDPGLVLQIARTPPSL